MNTVLKNYRTGAVGMTTLYDSTKENVELILKKRYKMTVNDINTAISISPLKSAFDENAEMAAHTSNEAWARRIYEFWKNNKPINR